LELSLVELVHSGDAAEAAGQDRRSSNQRAESQQAVAGGGREEEEAEEQIGYSNGAQIESWLLQEGNLF
jgi:hypothetical protein